MVINVPPDEQLTTNEEFTEDVQILQVTEQLTTESNNVSNFFIN